jgi:RimJ/RimL family protein N-acetyltransferase
MITIAPVTLEGHGVRLEPMEAGHAAALAAAVSDGRLWELFYTATPRPEDVDSYVLGALEGLRDGHMLPWVVREQGGGEVVGSTRYHDIVAAIDRVEIGYTFYAARWQRTHVNTACKLLLMSHAFDVLGCEVVALRTDRFNFRSQQAITRLGARLDGVWRHHSIRKDGSPRDTVMYSVLRGEWPEVRRNLELRLSESRSGRLGRQ